VKAKKIRNLVLIPLLVILLICISYIAIFKVGTVILNRANSERDVVTAINKHNYTFKGVISNTLYVPIISDICKQLEKSGKYIKRFGVKKIPFTSDIMLFGFELKYNNVACDYAAKYNERLILVLNKMGM
jgi:hypothetical protein